MFSPYCPQKKPHKTVFSLGCLHMGGFALHMGGQELMRGDIDLYEGGLLVKDINVVAD